MPQTIVGSSNMRRTSIAIAVTLVTGLFISTTPFTSGTGLTPQGYEDEVPPWASCTISMDCLRF